MLGRDAVKRLFDVRVCAMDEYDVTQLPDEVRARRCIVARASAHSRGLAPPPTPTPTPPSHPAQPLVLFAIATTGDGEMPDNGKAFWRFLLRRDLPGDSLSSTAFALFGLGDSGYAKFNAAARKVAARMAQLGAAAVVERGLGDDRSARGMAGDLDVWRGQLWAALDAAFPLPPGVAVDTSPQLLRCRLDVTLVEDATAAAAVRAAEEGILFPAARPPPAGIRAAPSPLAAVAGDCGAAGEAAGGARPITTHVVDNRRLTAAEWSQDVRHLVFEAGAAIPYHAGDVAVLHPRNPAEEVARLAARLGWQLDAVVDVAPRSAAARRGAGAAAAQGGTSGLPDAYSASGHEGRATLQPVGSPPPFPSRASVRHLLTHYVDICGVPRRGVLEQLALFAGSGAGRGRSTTGEEEREKLLDMAGGGGGDVYHLYCTQERRTYGELLEDFPSIAMPLAYLLDLLPPLQPRHFSIASAPAEAPSRVELCVAIVAYTTRFGRAKEGVASSWLAGLGVGAEVPMWVRSGLLTMPEAWASSAAVAVPAGTPPADAAAAAADAAAAAAAAAAPLILVGPGTGIAPMRSIWRQWAAVAARGAGGAACPPIHLFFGCRHRDSDWLYGEECTAAAAAGKGEAAEAGEGGGSTRAALALYETAFSRDVAPGAAAAAAAAAAAEGMPPRRVYVQHRLAAHAPLIADLLLRRGGRLLIAGSATQMPADVVDTVKAILAKYGGEALAAAGGSVDRVVAAMERERRLVVEAWS